jgi:uncharacterized membrane protein YqjE
VASPLDAMRRLPAALVTLLLSRAEFASLELAEARTRFLRWIVLALLGAILTMLALMVGSALLTVALWPRFGWGTLAALAVVYAVLALWVFRTLAVEHASTPPLLSETLRELANDRDAVFTARARRDEGGDA